MPRVDDHPPGLEVEHQWISSLHREIGVGDGHELDRSLPPDTIERAGPRCLSEEFVLVGRDAQCNERAECVLTRVRLRVRGGDLELSGNLWKARLVWHG